MEFILNLTFRPCAASILPPRRFAVFKPKARRWAWVAREIAKLKGVLRESFLFVLLHAQILTDFRGKSNVKFKYFEIYRETRFELRKIS